MIAKEELNFAVYSCQLGYLKIYYDEHLVVALTLEEHCSNQGRKTPLTDQVYQQIEEYLAGKRKTFTFAYELRGTDFAKQVWQELQKIPYGQVRSYKQIAQSLGKPNACRAVGNANTQNPLPLVFPCHRVINANGKIGGYAFGVEKKAYLLELEKLHTK
ncbi:hypothetical protein CJP74_02170 [Psittacicella melopsittaci]|uniref:Methylated-DNA--protein-cysteine methyltransferase n=1 Tax=Psittacicella melopsittaci TaxID=2028576 RepID=A0A3A1Y4T2_9GAMM|nr:methylated-DNA--[protein]-cysteine S-methyltransferase [Psittacicella melopsittaci]RIY33253.1 hypothetical protein CJP74_02170 [Psittacicella melopsittaci]